VDSVLGFYAGGLARVRGRGVNEKCILENPSGTPKPAYYAYQNLCALIDKSYVPIDIQSETKVTDPGIFYGIGPWEDAFPSVPLVACFQKGDGTSLLVHWLPWHGQEYLPKLARIDLVVKDVVIEEPVLIDLLSGAVYQLDGASSDDNTFSVSNLPLADYPIIIAAKSQVEIVKNRVFE
jgi:hypothetical protein